MSLQILKVLLATLRAAQLIHWTGHWQSGGKSQYGDHLLLERVYSGISDEIDTLAEKIVGKYGPDVVDPVEQAHMLEEATKVLTPPCQPVISRSLHVECELQKLFTSTYKVLDSNHDLSLGLDDFLMAMASNHDTYVYLLRQRSLE
jgi:DNA-binding ferritin-like protein